MCDDCNYIFFTKFNYFIFYECTNIQIFREVGESLRSIYVERKREKKNIVIILYQCVEGEFQNIICVNNILI